MPNTIRMALIMAITLLSQLSIAGYVLSNDTGLAEVKNLTGTPSALVEFIRAGSGSRGWQPNILAYCKSTVEVAEVNNAQPIRTDSQGAKKVLVDRSALAMACQGSVTTAIGGGDFLVNGERLSDTRFLDHTTAHYVARNIKFTTDGTVFFKRKDQNENEASGSTGNFVVDDVFIGSSDLVKWFLINIKTDNVRLLTHDNLKVGIVGQDEDPGILSVSVFPTEIFEGESVVLTWESKELDYCVGDIDFKLGEATKNLPTMGTAIFTENRVGERTYQLVCYGSMGVFTWDVTVNVKGNPANIEPSIEQFEASNTHLVTGQNTTLSWSTVGMNHCEASQKWGGTKHFVGTETLGFLAPGSKSLKLTCTDRDGQTYSKTRAVNVTNPVVGSAVQITRYGVTPNPVKVGGAITINWDSANSKHCKGIKPTNTEWNKFKPVKGGFNLAIGQSTAEQYVLRCFDANSSATVDASLLVVTKDREAKPVTTALSVNKARITEGETVKFSWTSQEATACETIGAGNGWEGKILPTTGSLVYLPRHDSMSMTYGVRCFNAKESTVSSVDVFSSLPKQPMGGNGCPAVTGLKTEQWPTIWSAVWPNPDVRKITIALEQGNNLAIEFKTGGNTSITAALTSAPAIGTDGTRTVSLSRCPGDYTYGELGVGLTLMDPDCIETWGNGGNINYRVTNNYVPNNGVCELKKNKTYYLNVRFSSACTASECRAVYEYVRTD